MMVHVPTNLFDFCSLRSLNLWNTNGSDDRVNESKDGAWGMQRQWVNEHTMLHQLSHTEPLPAQ